MIRVTDQRQLRQILRQLRRGQGLSQAQVAEKSYVTQQAIMMRENGKRAMHVGTFLEHVRALGFTVALMPVDKRRETGTGWPA